MWITAITLGLAGSLHCLGMCSPLVMAVTAAQPKVPLNKVVYNLGRITTYGLLGAVIGVAGFVIDLSWLQNWMSVLLGVLLIVFGVAGVSRIRIPVLTNLVNKLVASIKIQFSKLLATKGRTSLFALGMLNGLLPCGLTYIALAYCVTLDPITGFAYMFVFGLSTLPVMLGLTVVLTKWLMRFQFSFKKATTIMMISLGVLLVARAYVFHSGHSHSFDEHGITICGGR